MITRNDIIGALNERLQLFTGVAQEDISWESVVYRPMLPRPWLSVRLSSYVANTVGQGPDGVVQHDGTYTITAYASADGGDAQAAEISGQLRRHFTRRTALFAACVPLVILNSSEQTGIPYGDWFGIPVVVTFTALDPGV